MTLTLNKKLIGGFVLVAGIGLIIGLVGLSGLSRSSQALSEIRTQVYDRGQFLVRATDLARSAQVNFKIQVQEWKNILIRGNDRAQFDKYVAGFAKSESEVQRDLSELVSLLSANGVPTDKVKLAAETHRGLGTSYREALKSYDSSNQQSFQIVDKLVKGIDRAPTEQMDAVVSMVQSFEANVAQEREKAFKAEAAKLRLVTELAIAVGIIAAIVVGIWIGRSLSRQIRRIAAELRSGSSVVDAAANEVARYGQSLADATNSEAAAIQQASASLEVLSENTRKNAETALSATDIANRTRKAVDEGKRHVDEMNDAMKAIRESSDGISHILKSIDEIAFQTNILALNAAVEAARAGEAGAGFAVVADEVRSLAQRSAKAAQETSTRIEDSISKSKRGAEISEKVSASLDDILEKAQEVDQLVATIAQSSARNREGVEQVNVAIRQIEGSSQSNAAITEESAVAAQELGKQAENLNLAVHELSALVGDEMADAAERRPLSFAAKPQSQVRRQSAPAAAGQCAWSVKPRSTSDASDLTIWN